MEEAQDAVRSTASLLLPYVEHCLVLAQILLGLQLISSLESWLRRLESKPAVPAPLDDATHSTASSADFRLSAGEDGPAAPGPAHEWRTRPVMLRVGCGSRRGQQVEFNLPSTVFPIDSEFFSGRMFFRLRGCANEPRDYFSGKQRRLSAVIQGRFKRAVNMGSCFTGYEFAAPLDNLPPSWILRAGMGFIRTLAPTVTADVLGTKPYFLNPLCQTLQVLHAAEPGHEPDITDKLEETNHLLGGIFAHRRMDRIARKNYFAREENGRLHRFEEHLVYTMEYYEDKLDPSNFDLMMLGLRFNLHRYLAGQPLQIMAKLGSTPHDGAYLFNVEMWHESLLPGGWQPAGRSPSFACL